MTKKLIFSLIILLSLFILGVAIFYKSTIHPTSLQTIVKNSDQTKKIDQKLPKISLSGWIAWWKEDQAYQFINKYPDKIQTVSPVWYSIESSNKLVEVGKYDKTKASQQITNLNIRLIPSIGSEISSQQFSNFLHNQKAVDNLENQLIAKLTSLNASGLDVDLENIKKEDKDLFSSFLAKLSTRLKEKNLLLTVSVHARTKKIVWEGVLGQDLKKIGQIADEVRIMAYDEHSSSSQPGSISSLEWIKAVTQYNLTQIPKDKIVIGIPSYGYIWTKNDTKGYQYDEFHDYLNSLNYSTTIDPGSAEKIYTSPNFTGYLSDSQAMITKINSLSDLGITKFIIWHLGGMDEKFFE